MARLRLFPFLKSPTHKRRRIILLFALGIVLPSLLLGFLAFRGIQNDRALLEKERLEASRRMADKVIREVDDKISAVETALTAYAGDAQAPALQQLASKHSLVEEIFVLRQQGTIPPTQDRGRPGEVDGPL